MVLRCKIEKMRVGGFQDGVGECMEGQIGGKSGPGVLRTRQSGDLGGWGEAWESPEGGPKFETPEVHMVLAAISRPHPSRVS